MVNGQRQVPLQEFETRALTIVVQDPAFRHPGNGHIVTASVQIPAEKIGLGPWGYRVHVIDYDASTRRYWHPHNYGSDSTPPDPFKNKAARSLDRIIIKDPQFRQQNVYAIAMRTLARFESALGRRVSWGFRSHQLKIAPHAFADANAFYSREDHGLMFGYFEGSKNTVYTSLSHDVIAHETTHALLDGMRSRYMDPSSPDQAAFHEGFSDVVALLSVFSIPEALEATLRRSHYDNRVSRGDLTETALINSTLFTLAGEMGQELSNIRGRALRQSLGLAFNAKWKKDPVYREPHKRGEVLVAAMLRSFIRIWCNRLKPALVGRPDIDIGRVVETASETADYLLTMAIRALDYTPPVHITFPDYLSAILTADREMRPDDEPEGYRRIIAGIFDRYGIAPPRTTWKNEGCWERGVKGDLSYDRVHFGPMQQAPDEAFKFVWENRTALHICPHAYTQVISLRPTRRTGPDGFMLRETVAEVVQWLTFPMKLFMHWNFMQLKRHTKQALITLLKKENPLMALGEDFRVPLRGGSTLIFNDFGHLKFSIGTRVDNFHSQYGRLLSLYEAGELGAGRTTSHNFSNLHRGRGVSPAMQREEW